MKIIATIATQPNRTLPDENRHGQVVRCDEFPLEVGDSFEVFSCQLHGQSDCYAGLIVPARYQIVEADVSSVKIKRERSDSIFHSSAYLTRAILGGWSQYKKSSSDR